jgi:general stress protein 26
MKSSINQEQAEKNEANLSGERAVAKMRELVKKAATGFFCSAIKTGQRIETRPMAVQDVDEEGRLWFLSASDSSLNEQLAGDRNVQLMFQGSSHSDFLTLYGTAEVSRDRAKIAELWQPILKTWFTEGAEDPRITVICVRPAGGYYWDTKHNKAIVLAKMLVGAVMGKTLDDSIQGKVRVRESSAGL